MLISKHIASARIAPYLFKYSVGLRQHKICMPLKYKQRVPSAWCYNFFMPVNVANQRSHFRFWAYSRRISRLTMTYITFFNRLLCVCFVRWRRGDAIEGIPCYMGFDQMGVTQKRAKYLDFSQLSWNFQLLFRGCTTRFNQCFISLTIIPGNPVVAL